MKNAMKNIGWMLLAMAMVQALNLIIHPVTASEITVTVATEYNAADVEKLEAYIEKNGESILRDYAKKLEKKRNAAEALKKMGK